MPAYAPAWKPYVAKGVRLKDFYRIPHLSGLFPPGLINSWQRPRGKDATAEDFRKYVRFYYDIKLSRLQPEINFKDEFWLI